MERPLRKNEPVITLQIAGQAFGLAVVALLALIFGWTAELVGAVGLVVQTGLALAVAVYTRGKVTPYDTGDE